MKKIFSFALMLLGMVATLTSCSEDRDSNPNIQTPTTFNVNTPALADQYIQLSATNKVNLTWSQPNYGYNTLATYAIQVGLVQEDGTVDWNVKETTDADGNTVTENKFLETTFTNCNVNIPGEELARAINEIDGVTDPEAYVDNGYRKVALRVYSAVYNTAKEEIPGSGIMSENYVVYNNMADYCAVLGKDFIYCVGSCFGGWMAPDAAHADSYAPYRLFETEIGSNVYEGDLDIAAGDITFRFYAKLTGWDGGDSWGWCEADNNELVVEFDSDGHFTSQEDQFVKGKGSWKISGYPGGLLHIIVDMNQKKVEFQLPE